MTTGESDNGRARDAHDPVAGCPDGTWDSFLRETAHHAAQEPPALARMSGARVRPPAVGRPEDDEHTVGDIWEPLETPVTAWRDLDGPARRRRLWRALGAAVAVTLLLTLWSCAPTGAPHSRTFGDATVPSFETSPTAVPAATAGPYHSAPLQPG